MIFSLDAMAAFIVILLMLSVSMTHLFAQLSNQKENYEQFVLQRKLIEVSELMISNSEKGLAIYEENTVKHHEIQDKEIDEFVGFYIEILELGEESEHENKQSVSRIVLEEGEVKVVKVTAK